MTIVKARTYGILLPLLLTLPTGGCTDSPDTPIFPTATVNEAAVMAAGLSAGNYRSIDAYYGAVAQKVPGFGGMYFDDSGRPVTFLKDASKSDVARTVLSPVLDDRRGAPANMEFREALFDWAELLTWKRELLALLPLDGVVTLDIDERLNRIVLGIESGEAQAVVEDSLNEFGIPISALIFHQAEAVPLLAALITSKIRPMPGALKISHIGQGGWCTAGFNVNYGGDSTFMTASHCTATMAEVDHNNLGVFYQPIVNSGYQVGTEAVDPDFFTRDSTQECPTQTDCRWSDAALIQYDDTVDWSFGHIARTKWYSDGWSSGSRMIDEIRPLFSVTSTAPYPFAGDTLHKIGAATGWTAGPVAQTCQDADEGAYYIICYDVFDAEVDSGDSGSPVFMPLGGDSVRLYGLLWGGVSGEYAAFSNITQLEKDLGSGSLDVTVDPPPAPTPPTASISGPTVIKPDATCTWTANVTAGTEPLVYRWVNDGHDVSTDDHYTGGKLEGSLLDYFVLELTVTNAGGSDHDQITVHEDSGARICFR